MEYVYEVYREKSFSKAARKMFISQPSLSANIRRIEERLGYPIFDRSTKPLSLTEPGRVYIRCIEQILAVETEFSNYLNDWGGLKTGSLVLGGTNLFSSWVLPPLMAEFARSYPQVKLVLVEESTARLERLLLDGGVDLVIDYGMLDEKLFEKRLFQNEHLLLAVPKKFEVNRVLTKWQIRPEWISDGRFLEEDIEAVPFQAFREEPFIVLKPDNDTRKCAGKICRAYGFTPHILFELDQQMTAYNVTCSGMGVSFIGDTLVRRVPEQPEVVYYKLPAGYSERGLYFYWKIGRYKSQAMEKFLDLACR